VTKLVLLIKNATVCLRNLVVLYKKLLYLYSDVKRFETFKRIKMGIISVDVQHHY
jgi:hypothetical protein